MNEHTALKEALIDNGIDPDEITTDGNVYRYKYWEKLPYDVFKNFPQLELVELEDEDCGMLYAYKDKERKNG